MTIKEFIIKCEAKSLTERAEKLEAMSAPKIMIEGCMKAVADLEAGILPVSGASELLDIEYVQHEQRKGRGGKVYVTFNGTINYFPQAKYGRFITTKEG